jgi:hypothetical protein
MKTGNGAGLITRVVMLSAAVFIGGCASTPPTKIGGDTYYSSKTNTAGIFGDVSAVSGKLMVEGNQFCASMDKEFELVTQTTTSNIPGVRLGGASITTRDLHATRLPRAMSHLEDAPGSKVNVSRRNATGSRRTRRGLRCTLGKQPARALHGRALLLARCCLEIFAGRSVLA